VRYNSTSKKDEAIKTNDEYFLEAIGVLEQLVDYGRAELKKL
jgi:hypothetical protein